jgi:predicted dehydrogenase
VVKPEEALFEESDKTCYDDKRVGDVYLIKSSLYGYNGNMHDWHVYKAEGGGVLYDWGVYLIDRILYMVHSRFVSVFTDVRNIINKEVDDYFKILLLCGIILKVSRLRIA